MRRCAVTLVGCQVETRIAHIELLHHRIPVGFCEDGGSTDGGNACVALDDGFDCAAQPQVIEARQLVSIDLDVRGTYRQTQQRAAHREKCCAQDVEAVDLVAIRPGHRPRQRALADDWCESLPLLDGQDLRVCEAVYAAARIENHGRGDDRPGKRPPACLVNTRTAYPLTAPSNAEQLHGPPNGDGPRTSSRIAVPARS